jgi:hypothetical protein
VRVYLASLKIELHPDAILFSHKIGKLL